jgi:hypothetical protein
MGKIILTSSGGYNSCEDSTVDNTIEIEKVAINEQLTELEIKAFGCGIFTEVRIWVGAAYANNEDPVSFAGEELVDYQKCNNGGSPPCSGVDETMTELNMTLSPSDIGIDGDIIDDFIVVAFTNKRCWSYTEIEPGVWEWVFAECENKEPGLDPIDPDHPEDIQQTKIDEARVGVASFATIYPALIHKILMLDEGCSACSEINDALTLDMLIKAVTVYLSVDRVEEAWNAYNKARQMSQDYEDLYAKGPTACQTFGGIGCWLIDKNFVVSPSRVIYGSF